MSATSETAAPPEPDAGDVAWDLEPLVDGEGPAGAERLLDEATARARALAAARRGRVGELDGAGLAAVVAELATVRELVGRAASYASLSFSTDTADPARGALLARVEERSTAVHTELLFFDLEWAALPERRAEELLGAPGLDLARHHLRTVRRYAPHLLGEEGEKVLAEKAVTGRDAWGRLFAELTSAVAVDLDSGPAPLEVALARLTSPEREVRRGAAEAVTAALAPGLRTRAFVLNTLLADKATDDRLRSFPHWLASRNLANEVPDASVEALVEAVRRRYDLPQRWYALKARLLGLPRLADYDRTAALAAEDAPVGWPEAKATVLDAYASFSPELAAVARRFFDEAWIDAPVRPAKRGGAFCDYTVPSAHPYVMLNYTSRRRDVLTLAHELGHGVHASLSAGRGVFEQSTPLTLAETASVFGETVVFGRLLERAATPESRLALLAESVEGAIATVFRQVAMNRFEHLAHTARRTEGELSVEHLGDLWAESQGELFGDTVELTDGYRSWWSYIPHFVDVPGYVYAYAYGQLLALSVYRRYAEEGPSFVPDYLRLLSAGGSAPPEELGRIVGADLADPGFWDGGLAIVESQIDAAQEAAAEVALRPRAPTGRP